MRLQYNIALVFSVILVLFSCKKFEHKDVEPVVSCELCSYADSLEGVYKGPSSKVLWYVPMDYFKDSVEITVSHIFENLGAYHDSTVMHLQLDYVYMDSMGVVEDTETRFVSFTDKSKQVSTYGQLRVSYDSIQEYLYEATNGTGWGPTGPNEGYSAYRLQ